MDEIEKAKENIVPLKGGRSISSLVKAVSSQDTLSAREQWIESQIQ